jgi:hypothetical protein
LKNTTVNLMLILLSPTGRNPSTIPFLEDIEASTGIKTAFLFNAINTPVSLQKIPVLDYVIPSGMTLAQFANLASQALNTPFLLLIDDNTPFGPDIKSSYQTFKIGSIVKTDSVTVIPRFPVQPAVPPVQTGYYHPQSLVFYQSPVPTYPAGSSFPSSSVASAAAVSQAAPTTSEHTPQNPNPNKPATSSTAGNTPQNPNLNQAPTSSTLENTPQNLNSNLATTSSTAGNTPQNLNPNLAATLSVAENNPQSSNLIQLESSSISAPSTMANGLNAKSSQAISRSSAV